MSSVAAGGLARANHDGAFVWADSTTLRDVPSTLPDQFNVYASGGTRIFTNSAATVGVQLAPGGNTWSVISDRTLKANLRPVYARQILQKLSLIPITSWNLKSQDSSIRHIDPATQDFYTAFAVGEDDRHITTVDADGVALAAIQGLYQTIQERRESQGAGVVDDHRGWQSDPALYLILARFRVGSCTLEC